VTLRHLKKKKNNSIKKKKLIQSYFFFSFFFLIFTQQKILDLLSKMKKRKDAVSSSVVNTFDSYDEPKVEKGSSSFEPTIIYVWRRYEAVSLAEYLQGSNISAVSYHGGMGKDQRMAAQESFFRGNAQVIVATVAFGMGVDKADVRHIIHSSVPTSVENYLQETGRAGRDGLPSTCHLGKLRNFLL
jgi:superfamily II DNA helicase RecQ